MTAFPIQLTYTENTAFVLPAIVVPAQSNGAYRITAKLIFRGFEGSPITQQNGSSITVYHNYNGDGYLEIIGPPISESYTYATMLTETNYLLANISVNPVIGSTATILIDAEIFYDGNELNPIPFFSSSQTGITAYICLGQAFVPAPVFVPAGKTFIFQVGQNNINYGSFTSTSSFFTISIQALTFDYLEYTGIQFIPGSYANLMTTQINTNGDTIVFLGNYQIAQLFLTDVYFIATDTSTSHIQQLTIDDGTNTLVYEFIFQAPADIPQYSDFGSPVVNQGSPLYLNPSSGTSVITTLDVDLEYILTFLPNGVGQGTWIADPTTQITDGNGNTTDKLDISIVNQFDNYYEIKNVATATSGILAMAATTPYVIYLQQTTTDLLISVFDQRIHTSTSPELDPNSVVLSYGITGLQSKYSIFAYTNITPSVLIGLPDSNTVIFYQNISSSNPPVVLTNPSNINTNDKFGYSLAVNSTNTILAISSIDNNTVGSVYIYEWINSTWVYANTVPTPTLLPGTNGAQFGYSLTFMSNDDLIISSPGNTNPFSYNYGTIFTYKSPYNAQPSNIILANDSFVSSSSFDFGSQIISDSNYLFVLRPNYRWGKIYIYDSNKSYELWQTLLSVDSNEIWSNITAGSSWLYIGAPNYSPSTNPVEGLVRALYRNSTDNKYQYISEITESPTSLQISDNQGFGSFIAQTDNYFFVAASNRISSSSASIGSVLNFAQVPVLSITGRVFYINEYFANNSSAIEFNLAAGNDNNFVMNIDYLNISTQKTVIKTTNVVITKIEQPIVFNFVNNSYFYQVNQGTQTPLYLVPPLQETISNSGEVYTLKCIMVDTTAGLLTTNQYGDNISTQFNQNSYVLTGSGNMTVINTILGELAFLPAENYTKTFQIAVRLSSASQIITSYLTLSAGVNLSNFSYTWTIGQDFTFSPLLGTVSSYLDTLGELTTTISLLPNPEGILIETNGTIIVPSNVTSLPDGTLATSGTYTFNNSNKVLTFSGDQSDLQTKLDNLVWMPNNNPNYSAEFTLSISISASNEIVYSTNIDMIPQLNQSNLYIQNIEGDRVFNITPTNLSQIIDGNTVFPIILANPNLNVQNIQFYLSMNNSLGQSFSTNVYDGVTSEFNSSSGVWSIVGNIIQVNLALADVKFNPNSNYTPVEVYWKLISGTISTNGSFLFESYFSNRIFSYNYVDTLTLLLNPPLITLTTERVIDISVVLNLGSGPGTFLFNNIDSLAPVTRSSNSWTITGPATNVQNVLNGISYQPNGSNSFELSVTLNADSTSLSWEVDFVGSELLNALISNLPTTVSYGPNFQDWPTNIQIVDQGTTGGHILNVVPTNNVGYFEFNNNEVIQTKTTSWVNDYTSNPQIINNNIINTVTYVIDRTQGFSNFTAQLTFSNGYLTASPNPPQPLVMNIAYEVQSDITQTLTLGPASSTNLNYGSSICISSNGVWLAVGYPKANNNSGKVDVYENINNVWNKIATIISQDSQLGELFGYSVAVSNNGSLAIGAPNYTINNTPTGRVLFFAKNDVSNPASSWYTEESIIPQTEYNITAGTYGNTIAISADSRVISIGCTGSNNPEGLGYVEIIDRTQRNYGLENMTRTIVLPAYESNAEFGSALSLNDQGNILLVGAGSAQNGFGSIYGIQNTNNVGWVGGTIIPNPHPSSNPVSNSIYASRILVGNQDQALGSSIKVMKNYSGSGVIGMAGGPNTSSVVLITLNNNVFGTSIPTYQWNGLHEPSQSDLFGAAIDMTMDTDTNISVIISAIGTEQTYNTQTFNSAGRAWFFTLKDNALYANLEYNPATPKLNGQFGQLVGLTENGRLSIIAEPNADYYESQRFIIESAGALYVFG